MLQHPTFISIFVVQHSSACTNCHLVKRYCNQEAAEGGTVPPILLLMHLAFKTQTKISPVICQLSESHAMCPV